MLDPTVSKTKVRRRWFGVGTALIFLARLAHAAMGPVSSPSSEALTPLRQCLLKYDQTFAEARGINKAPFGIESDHVETNPGDGRIAQWYNWNNWSKWPNWNNWNNWRNWPNF